MTDKETIEAAIRILHRHPDLADAEVLEWKEVLINEMRGLAEALDDGPWSRQRQGGALALNPIVQAGRAG